MGNGLPIGGLNQLASFGRAATQKIRSHYFRAHFAHAVDTEGLSNAARLGALFEAKNMTNSGNTVFLCRARKHRKWEQPRHHGGEVKVIYPGEGHSSPIACGTARLAMLGKSRYALSFSQHSG
jgi:hypothetical protein